MTLSGSDEDDDIENPATPSAIPKTPKTPPNDFMTAGLSSEHEGQERSESQSIDEAQIQA